MSVQASCAVTSVGSVGLPSAESTFAASCHASIRSFARRRGIAQIRGKEPASTTADLDNETSNFQEDALPEQDIPDRAYR
jgi:hypothetical protein